MAFYPPISEAVIPQLQAVIHSAALTPGYLDNPSCPYPESLKRFLREITLGQPAVAEGPMDLEAQIEALVNDLNLLGQTLSTKDHAEKLSYFKTKTSLLEKLVGLKERILNLREMHEFQEIILTFLDELCTKDQISTLMLRLRNLESSK